MKLPTSQALPNAIGALGIAAYIGTGVFYLGSGLVMPYPWAFAMWVLWLGGWVVLFRAFKVRRLLTPTVAIAAMALWVAIVQLGSWLFGWTA